MNIIKLSVFTLTMGLFAVSCGSGQSDTKKTDSMTPATTQPSVTPSAAQADTQHMDTLTARPAKSPAEANALEAKKK